jgi:hypothetical protein
MSPEIEGFLAAKCDLIDPQPCADPSPVRSPGIQSRGEGQGPRVPDRGWVLRHHTGADARRLQEDRGCAGRRRVGLRAIEPDDLVRDLHMARGGILPLRQARAGHRGPWRIPSDDRGAGSRAARGGFRPCGGPARAGRGFSFRHQRAGAEWPVRTLSRFFPIHSVTEARSDDLIARENTSAEGRRAPSGRPFWSRHG